MWSSIMRFLQIFLWERFGGNTPRPVEFPVVEMVEVIVGGVGKPRKSSPFIHRLGDG